MKRDVKTVLYFLANGNLTPEAEADAKHIERSGEENTHVKFRNGSVPVTGKLEKCDYIAGDPIPAEYLQSFPKIDATGSVDASNVGANFSGATADVNGPASGEVPQAGTEASPLAAEVGSVGGDGGWGTPGNVAPKA